VRVEFRGGPLDGWGNVPEPPPPEVRVPVPPTASVVEESEPAADSVLSYVVYRRKTWHPPTSGRFLRPVYVYDPQA